MGLYLLSTHFLRRKMAGPKERTSQDSGVCAGLSSHKVLPRPPATVPVHQFSYTINSDIAPFLVRLTTSAAIGEAHAISMTGGVVLCPSDQSKGFTQLYCWSLLMSHEPLDSSPTYSHRGSGNALPDPPLDHNTQQWLLPLFHFLRSCLPGL